MKSCAVRKTRRWAMCIRLKSIGKPALLGLRETRQSDGMVSLPVYCRVEWSSHRGRNSFLANLRDGDMLEVKPDCVVDNTPSRYRRPDDAPDGH
jgi:hypothetical protein